MSKQINSQSLKFQSLSPKLINGFKLAINEQRLNGAGLAFTPVKNTILFPTIQHNTCSQQPLNKYTSFLVEEEKKQLIKKLIKQIQELTQRIAKLQKLIENKKTKRIRRKSTLIPKSYKCNHKQCGKNYGSQTALKKHKRTKHNNEDDASMQMEKINQYQ